MAKYHINSRGVPAICRAKNSCPLGGAFGSKSEAAVVATKEREEYTAQNKEKNAEARKYFNANLERAQFSDIERGMAYHNAEALEDVNNQIASLRDGRPISEVKDELLTKSNELHARKQDIANETRAKLLETDKAKGVEDAQAEVDKWKAKIQEQENAVKEKNEGSCPKCGEGKLVKKNGSYGEFIACDNFPKCKHTQKPVVANPEIKKRLTNAEANLRIENQKFNKVVQEEAAEDKLYKTLDKQQKEVRQKMNVADYIDTHENPTPLFRGHKPEGDITPIEKYYTQRKEADEAIEKKIGTNKLAINSGSLKFGDNEINERLTVDSKGNINNLYIESQSKLGEVQRVVKIHEDGQGNIELENGERITMSSITNWRMDRNQTPPQAWKFYTTNSKSKKEYNGHRKLIVHNIDTSD